VLEPWVDANVWHREFTHIMFVTAAGDRAMVETRNVEDSRRDERVLVDRLINRQGLSRDEAVRTVGNYREGKRVEIDPILMEGLDSI
jgi:hypothetical protein